MNKTCKIESEAQRPDVQCCLHNNRRVGWSNSSELCKLGWFFSLSRTFVNILFDCQFAKVSLETILKSVYVFEIFLKWVFLICLNCTHFSSANYQNNLYPCVILVGFMWFKTVQDNAMIGLRFCERISFFPNLVCEISKVGYVQMCHLNARF